MCIVKFIYNAGYMFTGMIIIKRSCDIRRAHSWYFFPYHFVDGIVRAFESFRPHKFDVVVMSLVVKGEVFQFIGRGLTKNYMVFCELHQDQFYCVAMYKTRMLYINVMNNFKWEEIQLCPIFVGTFFSWANGIFRGEWVV